MPFYGAIGTFIKKWNQDFFFNLAADKDDDNTP